MNYNTLTKMNMKFPQTRMRRLRKNPAMRNMVSETTLSADDLVMPFFVCPGESVSKPIPSMPGNYQHSTDNLVSEIQNIKQLGISSVLLFGIPEYKDEDASVARQDDSIVPRAIRAIKEAMPDMYVIADVCNCEYTTHGHCGIVENGDVENDKTLEILAEQSVVLARAGADMVAPSDMMDGRVKKIREALDAANFKYVPILSYAAKYASAFYGPFRDAAESSPQFGDRKSYQMNPANSREAQREIELDIEEGADIVMVKPALSYLDVIYRVRQAVNVPIAAYNVSGEFSMIKAASEKQWINEIQVAYEVLLSIKRAGADIIITYYAKDIAKVLDGR